MVKDLSRAAASQKSSITSQKSLIEEQAEKVNKEKLVEEECNNNNLVTPYRYV